jgi:hypothetical protein
LSFIFGYRSFIGTQDAKSGVLCGTSPPSFLFLHMRRNSRVSVWDFGPGVRRLVAGLLA